MKLYQGRLQVRAQSTTFCGMKQLAGTSYLSAAQTITT